MKTQFLVGLGHARITRVVLIRKTEAIHAIVQWKTVIITGKASTVKLQYHMCIHQTAVPTQILARTVLLTLAPIQQQAQLVLIPDLSQDRLNLNRIKVFLGVHGLGHGDYRCLNA